jgi:hypothetical protein
MKGNTNWQVQQIYTTINGIGESRHEAKAEARENGAKTSAEISKQTKINSFATADAYRDVWRSIADHAKVEFGVKNMEQLTGQHVSSYLEAKIDDGVSRATFDQYCAAGSKLEAALNRYAEAKQTGCQYNFDLKPVRAMGAAELGSRNHVPRAYSNPLSMQSHLDGVNRLTATMQHESGARIKEVSQIKESQLRGLHTDRISGELRGRIMVDGKGGKERILQLSLATYSNLKAAIVNGNGVHRLDDYKTYLADLKAAANETKQEYQGSHGLRWGFAQERMAEMQKNGLSYEEALREVSQEMGHERSDITEHYLK